MFNDSISMGYFDVYDQYILNLLYDPRIKAGMTVQEVKAVLPDVLADVRAWVRRSPISPTDGNLLPPPGPTRFHERSNGTPDPVAPCEAGKSDGICSQLVGGLPPTEATPSLSNEIVTPERKLI
jgi:hypothetical protein